MLKPEERDRFLQQISTDDTKLHQEAVNPDPITASAASGEQFAWYSTSEDLSVDFVISPFNASFPFVGAKGTDTRRVYVVNAQGSVEKFRYSVTVTDDSGQRFEKDPTVIVTA